MASIGGYSSKAFTEQLKLLALDPSTQSTTLTTGQSLVEYLQENLDQIDEAVLGFRTTDAAVNEDLEIGKIIYTTGGSLPNDGQGGPYLVVAAGEGDRPMANGNELLLLPFGSLAGSDVTNALVASSEGTKTVAEYVDSRVIYVASEAELKALPSPVEGQIAYLKGAGEYKYSSGSWSRDIPDDARYSYTQMGKAFDSKEVTAPIKDNFAAWVHATVDYDADDDKFIVFYNINPGHDIARNRVLLGKKPVEGGFEAPVAVADNTGVESLKTQAAGIAPNGDYVALVGVFDWGVSTSKRTDIYRSLDKGATWSVSVMRDSADNSNIVAYNGDVSGFLKLSSGRLITLAVEPDPSFLTRIYYSDDNGATWSKASIAGSPTDVTEPAWIELPDGAIVCMARAAVRTGSTSTRIPAKFMLSNDSGLTWSAPVDSVSITDFTLSNGQMLINEESKTVEFIHHSRYTDSDSLSSLYISTASFDDAKADKFSNQVRVGKLAAYVPLGDSSGDSGYVGAAKSTNGVVNVFYYNGLRTSAQINWAIGRKSAAKEREFLISPVTGESKGLSFTGHKTRIYAGKLESYNLAAPVAQGLIADTGVFRKNEGSIHLSLSTTGRAGAKLTGGIDLTDIDYIYCAYEAQSFGTGGDFGVFLYNKASPASATDGRVAFSTSGLLGKNVVALDVLGYSGVYYPQMILSDTVNDGGGSAFVSVNEIGVVSNVFLGGEPSEPGVNHSLYFRGNQYPYLSEGWATGYSDPASTINLAADRIVVTADGSAGAARQAARTGLVNLTNRTMIEAIVDVDITNSTASDFGLAVFSTGSPTSPTDGRVAFNYTKTEGIYKATLDVTALTGDLYVFIMATANSTAGAPSVVTASILDVRLY